MSSFSPVLLTPLLVGLGYAGIGLTLGQATRKGADPRSVLLVSTAVSSLVCLALVLLFGSGAAFPSFPLVATVLLGGSVGVLGHVAFGRATAAGDRATSWTISQSALIAPALFGEFFLQRALSGLQWAGLLLIPLALVLLSGFPSRSSTAIRSSALSSAFLAFLLYAASLVLQTLPTAFEWTSPPFARPFLFLLGQFLTLLVLRSFRSFPVRPATSLPFLHAALTAAAILLTFPVLDAFRKVANENVVFPIAIASSMGFVAVLSRLIFRETTPRRTWAGVLLALVGTLLLGIP